MRIAGIVVVGAAMVVSAVSAWANNAPQVSNVTASQRGDASRLVDIHYTLTDADGDACTVWVSVSDNGGTSWTVPARTFTGDIGMNIAPGANKSIVWDAGLDMPGRVATFRVRVWADDGNGPAAMVLVPAGWFPYQNVSNPNQWVFVDTFLIDKYETTNQFYCQFLNAGGNDDHWDSNQQITQQGTAGNYYYTVIAGMENYPVIYVNYTDATHFAVWRSTLEGRTYHLPTQGQWEKAAAWDPVAQHYFMYGFHQDTISCAWCNYWPGPACVGTTTPVGYYNGTGGRHDAKSYYGAYDMSGNVWEWTNVSSGVIRGGSWDNCDATYCRCVSGMTYSTSERRSYVGFRLVLDSN